MPVLLLLPLLVASLDDDDVDADVEAPPLPVPPAPPLPLGVVDVDVDVDVVVSEELHAVKAQPSVTRKLKARRFMRSILSARETPGGALRTLGHYNASWMSTRDSNMLNPNIFSRCVSTVESTGTLVLQLGNGAGFAR